jgi:hypothetical protein
MKTKTKNVVDKVCRSSIIYSSVAQSDSYSRSLKNE